MRYILIMVILSVLSGCSMLCTNLVPDYKGTASDNIYCAGTYVNAYVSVGQ
jgi:uncharacterized protein YceK